MKMINIDIAAMSRKRDQYMVLARSKAVKREIKAIINKTLTNLVLK